MKRILALALALALLLCGCMFQGNVNHVRKDVGESAVYTEAEIEAAMDTVLRHFRRNFEGRTLLQLYYEEDTARNHAFALDYNEEQCIVLLSSFETGPDSAGMGLNDNDIYNHWSWILTRSDGGDWTLRSWGYA